jgi:cellulose biosynthesis protein BcsQ
VLAVYNLKGGVGKTATAVNLAYVSARAGARVLLWDLDPQGAATFYFRVEPRVRGGVGRLLGRRRALDRFVKATDYEGLDVLPADFSYRVLDLALDAAEDRTDALARKLRPLAASYDHVYLDCAPSVSLASEGVFRCADALVVPTVPTTLSQRSLEQLTEHLDRVGGARPKVLAFFCMVDRRKAMHRAVCEQREIAGVRLLDAEIPYSSTVEQMGLHRAPVGEFARGSAAAEAYEALWRELFVRCESWLGWARFAGSGARAHPLAERLAPAGLGRLLRRAVPGPAAPD